jgi:LmbE family N-acetylglucosaminyl deacetylase
MGEGRILRWVTTYLVVAAHPDDAEFGVAGTAARLASEGHTVYYLLCTSGDAGADDPSIAVDDLIRTREAEQDAAGRILGLSGVYYLRHTDGELVPSLELRKTLTRWMRKLKADVVMCQDPRSLVNDESTYLNHPDHRAAGQAAMDAAFPAAGNPSAYRDLLVEGLAPHKVREVWLYFTSSQHVNHWVDITQTFEQKLQALEAHASQLGEWASTGKMRQEMIRWATEAARKHELPFDFAEGFQRIVLESEQQQAPEAAAIEAQAEGSA